MSDRTTTTIISSIIIFSYLLFSGMLGYLLFKAGPDIPQGLLWPAAISFGVWTTVFVAAIFFHIGSSVSSRTKDGTIIGQLPPPPTMPAPSPPSPPPPAPVPVKPPAPTPVPTDNRFAVAYAYVLQWEGGNDDDHRDPGGRTSRGILQREWDIWRQTHPALPPDVWNAPQDQVRAIYWQNYWLALSCDELPPGIDYCVFDYGVNSGNSRSAKLLQQLVGVTVDGEIGPDTIAATAKADPVKLINQLCDQRLAFLKGLGDWVIYGRGWTDRVEGVRKQATAMVGAAPPVTPTQTPTPTTGEPAWLTAARAEIGFHETGDNHGIQKYVTLAGYGADGEPWCSIFAGAMLKKARVDITGANAMAQSWITAPCVSKIDAARVGCLAVFWRGSKGSVTGHVGFYIDDAGNGRINVLGGNENDQVEIEPIATNGSSMGLLGYYWPVNDKHA